MLRDFLLGPCIRRLDTGALHLTFDDGPHPEFTPRILEALARHGAKATFFVVAERALRERRLVDAIRGAGHAIGNHSLDHTFGAFFAPKERLRDWIAESEARLRDLLGEPTVGFRSPAGVRTPPLRWALGELGLPLVHWNVRFYDTRLPWREAPALASLARTAPGSIVLLHDTHEGTRAERFLSTLDAYLAEARRRSLRLETIPPQRREGTA